MIKTYKVMLCPNNKQQSRLFLYAAAARYAYNWAVITEKTNHESGKAFIREHDLRHQFTQFKKSDKFNPKFHNISNDVMKQGIRDAVASFKRFFANKSDFPKFKSARKTKPSFYQDTCKIKFSETHVRIENLAGTKRKNRDCLNWIRLAEKSRIPVDAKYLNPRITYDGLHWWVSVGIEYPNETNPAQQSEGLGIDLGIKDFAILSDGTSYPNLNKSNYIKKLKRRERRLQRTLSKKFLKNKKGKCYKKTRNIKKTQKRLLKLTKHITNILREYIKSVVHKIISKNPKFIVLEDLAVKNMLRNRKLSKAIQEQRFGLFRQIMTERCQRLNITLIIANRWFPSSKRCIQCGALKHDLTLKTRTYHCSHCNNIINRDYQAALNLKQYGLTSLQLV